MQGGSGLNRGELHHACEVKNLFVRDEPSTNSGVREEDLRERYLFDARLRGVSDEDAQRELFAFRASVVSPEERSIPIAERSPGLGHVAVGDIELLGGSAPVVETPQLG